MSFNKNFVEKKQSTRNIDSLVNTINNKIGKALGKKNNFGGAFNNQNNKAKIKNWIFSLVIIFLLVFLWAITGFYYLSDNQYGLVIRNGKVVDVVKGIKFGLNAPYPIDQLQLINAAVSENMSIGKLAAIDPEYIVLSKNLKPFEISVTFTYQVIDPKALFLTIFQNEDKVKLIIKWNMMKEVRQYISAKMEDELTHANLIVTANEIRYKLNKNLSNYGLKINKLDIESLKRFKSQITITGNKEEINIPILDKLLLAANDYHKTKVDATKVNIDKFNQLFIQYKKNPQSIIEQMYYDMLAVIPVHIQNNFALLNISLSELILLSNQNELLQEDITQVNFRDASRIVRRYRNISD